MTRKKIDFIFDLIYWSIVCALPILIFIFNKDNTNGQSMFSNLISDFFDSGDVTSFLNNDFVTSILYNNFSIDFNPYGIALPVNVILLLGYFVNANIIHLFIDVLLFIPRFAHDLINSPYGKE